MNLCNVRIRTDDYIICEVKMDSQLKKYITISSRMQSKDVFVMIIDENIKLLIEENNDEGLRLPIIDSKIKNVKNSRIYLNYPVGSYVFVCLVEESEINLELYSDYFYLKKLTKKGNLFLQKEWRDKHLYVIPYNKLSVQGQYILPDTVEVHIVKMSESDVNNVYVSGNCAGMMCLCMTV